jgi:hypothetical protein
MNVLNLTRQEFEQKLFFLKGKYAGEYGDLFIADLTELLGEDPYYLSFPYHGQTSFFTDYLFIPLKDGLYKTPYSTYINESTGETFFLMLHHDHVLDRITHEDRLVLFEYLNHISSLFHNVRDLVYVFLKARFVEKDLIFSQFFFLECHDRFLKRDDESVNNYISYYFTSLSNYSDLLCIKIPTDLNLDIYSSHMPDDQVWFSSLFQTAVNLFKIRFKN